MRAPRTTTRVTTALSAAAVIALTTFLGVSASPATGDERPSSSAVLASPAAIDTTLPMGGGRSPEIVADPVPAPAPAPAADPSSAQPPVASVATGPDVALTPGEADAGATNADSSTATPGTEVSTSVTAFTVTLTWTVAPNGSDVSAVYAGRDGVSAGGYQDWETQAIIGNTGTVTFKNLIPGTQYTVYAQPVVGGVRGAKASVTVTTLTDDGTPPVVPAPTPAPATATLFGANFTDSSGVDESLYRGRPKVARIFMQGLGGLKWGSIARVQRATSEGIKTFVVSWRDRDAAHVKAFLATIPDGITVYACFNHEPEDDAGKPGDANYAAWSAEWKRQWTIQSPLIRAEGFIPTQILMAWTTYPGSHRNIDDWTAPKGTVDVFAFDGYVNNQDPTDLVNHMVAATKHAGLTRTGLAETGSQITDPNRASKLATLRHDVLASTMFDWAIYWNAQDPGFDCRLDPASSDAWFGKTS